MTLEEAQERYGKIENGRWYDQDKWCIVLGVPPYIAQAWINSITGKPATKIYCNKDLVDPLLKALYAIRESGIVIQLKTFDGCLCIRNVRGRDHLSAHSYGIAIDINAKTNALGEDGDISDELAQCFIQNGFRWGKHLERKDPMHFTLGW